MKKRCTSRFAFSSPRALTALFVFAAAGCLVVSGTLPAFFLPETQIKNSQRTLTFGERVAYQRAIEEVYWRHRIWPKERSDPKPSLEAVMSQAQLEKKVEDYLRKSQALEDYWQRPLTAEQLQAEMDRMAKHTRQPEALRELYEALGDNPFLIAECLARPALADRFLANWYAYDQRIHGELKQRTEADLRAHNTVEQMRQTSGTYSETEFVKSDSGREEAQRTGRIVKLNSREWDETVQKLAATFSKPGTPKASVFARNGGLQSAAGRSASTVGVYETIPLGTLGALQEDETRYYATAVLNRATARLNVATVSWLKESLESWLDRAESQAPIAIRETTASYTLPKIALGGCIDDTWTATSGPPDSRRGHTAVWTGSEMIVWGGVGFGAYLNTGGRYNPGTDNWTATNSANAPTARDRHTAVWTGTQMIVWGGYFYDGSYHYLNTGSRYDPSTDSWTATSTTNAPEARYLHTAVWTDGEMIVWGGQNYPTFLNTGGRYTPGTDSWTAISITNAPSVRAGHTAVWTGNEMIVWGGEAGIHNSNIGGRYNPSMDSWTATGANNVPAARSVHTAVWTGSEMIVWGGYFYDGNYHNLNTGGRYNPAIDSWLATSPTNAPEARYFHTAVWTGSEMIVWGGSTFDYIYLNTGGRYNPIADSWTATNTINAPIARWLHTAVWTGSEMVVWGGHGDSGEFNTGGRYNPITDSWIATNTTDTPIARASHTAVWTGSEMIVWGGWNGPDDLASGGRYDPVTDGWTATSITNAPAARAYHTAVWMGSEMIVWGGYHEFTAFNTGGRYNPGTNSWTATSIANAPSARFNHTAVWTGTETIVWGGSDYVGDRFNTGGRYNPSSDSWTDTSINGPISRSNHTAVWTGSEMIVWGGYDGFNYLSTGDRYCAQSGPTPTPTPTSTATPTAT